MQIIFYQISDDINTINKTLGNPVATLEGTLKESTSVTNPTITIAGDTAVSNGANYMYMPNFDRYYFIDDIVSVRNGVWSISGSVDVLQSFRDPICNCKGIIDRLENEDAIWASVPDSRFQYRADPVYSYDYGAQLFDASKLTYSLVVIGG